MGEDSVGRAAGMDASQGVGDATVPGEVLTLAGRSSPGLHTTF